MSPEIQLLFKFMRNPVGWGITRKEAAKILREIVAPAARKSNYPWTARLTGGLKKHQATMRGTAQRRKDMDIVLYDAHDWGQVSPLTKALEKAGFEDRGGGLPDLSRFFHPDGRTLDVFLEDLWANLA